MKQKLKITLVLMLLSLPFIGNAQDEGQAVFVAKCSPCHSIGNGRLVGPDLKGVHKKYSLKYLEQWIKSSQSVINGGNAKAKALFEEYNSIVMPDFPELKSEDIKRLANYIKAQSSETETAATAPATTEDKKTTIIEASANPTTTPTEQQAPIEEKQDLNAASTTASTSAAAPEVKAALVSSFDAQSVESPVTLILTSVTLLLLIVVMFMALRIFIVIKSMDKEKTTN